MTGTLAQVLFELVSSLLLVSKMQAQASLPAQLSRYAPNFSKRKCSASAQSPKQHHPEGPARKDERAGRPPRLPIDLNKPDTSGAGCLQANTLRKDACAYVMPVAHAHHISAAVACPLSSVKRENGSRLKLRC